MWHAYANDSRVKDLDCDLYTKIANLEYLAAGGIHVLQTHLVSVGNKDDDPDRKVVLTQDAQRFAEQMGIQLFETSAKENKNVEEVSVYIH